MLSSSFVVSLLSILLVLNDGPNNHFETRADGGGTVFLNRESHDTGAESVFLDENNENRGTDVAGATGSKVAGSGAESVFLDHVGNVFLNRETHDALVCSILVISSLGKFPIPL